MLICGDAGCVKVHFVLRMLVNNICACVGVDDMSNTVREVGTSPRIFERVRVCVCV